MSTTLGSAAISSNMAWRMASRNVTGAIAYLRAFPRAAVFAATDLLPVFPEAAGSCTADGVSPKCIGAFSREEDLPRPKPSTNQTGSTLDLGGISSAIGRSHLGRILWQSSPVQ